MSQGQLSLYNCQVTGSNPDRSIGALAFRGGLSVVDSRFSSLKHGIVTYDRYNIISTNLFEDCREAIYQGGGGPNDPNPLDVTTTLTCNRFLNGSTFSGTKYGLYVEDGVLMNDIGGPGSGTQSIPPNANVFPTAGARPTQDKFTVNNQDGWDVPSDFVAVRFPVGSQAKYYRYVNEYVGEVTPSYLQNVQESVKECYTTANIPPNPTPDQVEVCPSLATGVVYFPMRIGTPTSLGKELRSGWHLYPNPAERYVKVDGPISDGEMVVLIDVLGKHYVPRVESTTTGVKLLLDDLPSGIYSFILGGRSHKFVKQ